MVSTARFAAASRPCARAVAFFDAKGDRLKTTYLARTPEPFEATLIAYTTSIAA